MGEDEAREHFKAALDNGINFFDTADMYSVGVSEEITGKMLRGMVPNREDYVLATKVYNSMGEHVNNRGLSAKHIHTACDASLKRLGVDYIDLYQIHRFDQETPIEETLDALDSLVRAGKVRYLGASSMAAWQFAKAVFTAEKNGWHKFVSMQNHYNLVYREEEREMIPFCIDQGIGIIPWSPLARGFLAGKRTRQDQRPTTRAQTDKVSDELYYKEEDFQIVDVVNDIAEKRGLKPAQIALAWMLSLPWVDAPIIGSTKLQHLQDALEALDVKLSDEEIAKLEEPYKPRPILGHDQPTPRAHFSG